MALIKCPKCGELYADSYQICPFCTEDEEFYGKKKRKNVGSRGKAKAPSILGPAFLLVVLLVVGVGLYMILSGEGGQSTVKPEKTDPVPVELTLTPTELTLTEGDSETLTVNESGVHWTSSDEEVASVEDDGTVTANSEGNATITAVSGDRSAACVVTVEAEEIDEDEPEHSPEQTDLAIETIYGELSKNGKGDWEFTARRGDSFGMEVTGTTDEVTWSSTDEDVAVISRSGTFKAVGKGHATLVAEVDGQTLRCDVLVN